MQYRSLPLGLRMRAASWVQLPASLGMALGMALGLFWDAPLLARMLLLVALITAGSAVGDPGLRRGPRTSGGR